ncbi:BTB/POZ domain-containing protein [Aspergillus stella-maris]|uniref:BTB/POZ domain-containing protein n=1 Tax=Aspergillus stella-maris TaxID=1810926 RepID=UPI003CCD183E
MATEIIDADGDAIIDCSGVTFRVWTLALSLASPVFRAMFKPRFSEGLAVRDASDKTKTAVISLPDDDPEAFRIFCNIAHHKLALVPTQLDAKRISLIAQFIDKYNCTEAIGPLAEKWIENLGVHDEAPKSPEDLWSAMLLAYAFEDRSSFTRYSIKLLTTTQMRFRTWRHAVENIAFLPEAVLGLCCP